MPSEPILRFAPSPNGQLHLGHAYSALFTARWAERLGGTLPAAHRRHRHRPLQAGIHRGDLRGPALARPRLAGAGVAAVGALRRLCRGCADRLRRMGLLYPCFCSRTEIAGARARHRPRRRAALSRHLPAPAIRTRPRRGWRPGRAPQWRLRTRRAPSPTPAS